MREERKYKGGYALRRFTWTRSITKCEHPAQWPPSVTPFSAWWYAGWTRKPGLEGATCRRTTGPNGAVFENVVRGMSSDGRDLTDEELDKWVAGWRPVAELDAEFEPLLLTAPPASQFATCCEQSPSCLRTLL